MTVPTEITDAIKLATHIERQRNVAIVRAAYGVCRLSGHEATARILDALASKMESDDSEGDAA